MTAANAPERAETVAAAVGGEVTQDYGQCTVEVPPDRWTEALTAARDIAGLAFFDWLSAVDELPAGFAVVAHLADPGGATHLLLRTRLGREHPSLPTATTIFPGAAWHERETWEMFGIEFDGHPNLVPLLLPDGFTARPLRKDFVLAARAVRDWPGAKDPSDAPRRRTLPPGVPEPGTWAPGGPT